MRNNRINNVILNFIFIHVEDIDLIGFSTMLQEFILTARCENKEFAAVIFRNHPVSIHRSNIEHTGRITG